MTEEVWQSRLRSLLSERLDGRASDAELRQITQEFEAMLAARSSLADPLTSGDSQTETPPPATPDAMIQADIAALIERDEEHYRWLEDRDVLITGATGLLARYLTETIAWLNRHRFTRPCRLTGIVRTMPAPDGPCGHLLHAPGVHFVRHDARHALKSLGACDFMILAATKGAPRHYLDDPIGTLQLNGSGLEEWLDLAVRLNTQSVLYISSGEVYGTPGEDQVPTPEHTLGTLDLSSDRAVYGGGKQFGELLCRAWMNTHDLDVKIVRPFQVFGPGIRPGDGRAMADFLIDAAEGRDIRLRSAGKALRTYMYVSDATHAFWQVLRRGQAGRAYNVGSQSPEVTILDLAERIARAAGSVRVHVENRETAADKGSPQRTCPDTSRLRDEIGVVPTVGLDLMIERTLSWLRQQEVA